MNALYKLFEYGSDAAFGISSDGAIRYWNDAFVGLLGMSAGEVRGRACAELLCGRDLEGNEVCGRNCRVPRTVSRGSCMRDFDLVVEDRQGRPMWLNIGSYHVPPELKRVANGVSVFFSVRPVSGHRLLRRLASESRQVRPDKRGHSSLTVRETEVLKKAAEGANTAEIAELLSISPATVKNHFKHIFAKLEVHSRAEAVSHAMQQLLI
ncbi:MAG TPA: PAS and helix-turn-helix domain-containing protein [Gammaproteobacteria bacterium]|nr:PAS and helix-turn-helix domain-containing protein [Gammaproteobacteria bacterium]